jgi:hypothetical protein
VQIGRTVTDQHGALDGGPDSAVLDLVGLGALKYVFARGDVDLPAAKADGIKTIFYRSDDFLPVVRVGEHVCVGHPRHGHMRMRFSTAISGWRHSHQTCVLSILHVAHQDPIFDQYCTIGWRAFVIDRE